MSSPMLTQFCDSCCCSQSGWNPNDHEDILVSSIQGKQVGYGSVKTQISISDVLSSIFLFLMEETKDAPDGDDTKKKATSSKAPLMICPHCAEALRNLHQSATEFYQLCNKEGKVFSRIVDLRRDLQVEEGDILTSDQQRPSQEVKQRYSLRQRCKQIAESNAKNNDAKNVKTQPISDDEQTMDDATIDDDFIGFTHGGGSSNGGSSIEDDDEFVINSQKYEVFCSDSSESTDKDDDPSFDTEHTCEVCHKTFSSSGTKQRHMKQFHSNNEIKRYRCPVEDCDKTYSRRDHVNAHITAVHPNVPTLKDSRKQMFKEDSQTDDRYPCPVGDCSKTYSRRDHLNVHLRAYHPTVPITRHPRPRPSTSRFISKRSKDANARRPCPVEGCDKTYSRRDHLNVHIISVHPTVPIVRVNKEGSNRVSCPVEDCSEYYTRMAYLSVHLKRAHPNVPINSLKFPGNKNVKLRIKSKDRKKSTCHECGMVVRSDHLKNHLTVHSNERNHLCAHCGKCFRTLRTLNLHMKDKHVKDRKFVCPQCGQSFVRKGVLDKHIVVMHERPDAVFTCDTCGKQFCHEQNLKAHLKMHQDGESKNFSCPICHKHLSRMANVRQHMKTVHEGVKVQRKTEQKGPTRNTVTKKLNAGEEDESTHATSNLVQSPNDDQFYNIYDNQF